MSVQVNGEQKPPLKFTIEAAGPFPWQKILWGILGVAIPVLVKWVGDALAPPGTPPTDEQKNPPT